MTIYIQDIDAQPANRLDSSYCYFGAALLAFSAVCATGALMYSNFYSADHLHSDIINLVEIV